MPTATFPIQAARITAGAITCPGCHLTFRALRARRGDGAQYVDEWHRIPAQLVKMLSVWLSDDTLRETPTTKRELRLRLANLNLTITENACAARVSELLGLRLIFIMEPERRPRPHDTESAPRYMLNIDRVTKVLNAGGRLS